MSPDIWLFLRRYLAAGFQPDRPGPGPGIRTGPHPLSSTSTPQINRPFFPTPTLPPILRRLTFHSLPEIRSHPHLFSPYSRERFPSSKTQTQNISRTTTPPHSPVRNACPPFSPPPRPFERNDAYPPSPPLALCSTRQNEQVDQPERGQLGKGPVGESRKEKLARLQRQREKRESERSRHKKPRIERTCTCSIRPRQIRFRLESH